MNKLDLRAWHKKEKKMYQIIAWSEKHVSGDMIMTHTRFNIEKPSRKFGTVLEWVIKSEVEVMTFIGIEDKNGKKIYEGDIVKHYKLGDLQKEDPIVGEVTTSPTSGAMAGHWPINIFDCEVVGNIYQNRNLIK